MIPSKNNAKDWQKLKNSKDKQGPRRRKEKNLQEIENLKQQEERTQARIDALQEDHGSNLESDTELNRLRQLKKIIKSLIQRKKKWPRLKKKKENKEKAQAKLDRES